MFKDYLYNGKDKFKISKVSTNETSLCKDKEDALEKMEKNEKKLAELQQKLYAEKKEGLIIVIQAMDGLEKMAQLRMYYNVYHLL